EEKPKNWDWTLGETQYNWLKTTLENNHSPYKFVFAHHNRGQGRGGAIPARGYEWGGYGNNGNGSWEFDQMRPGWAMPIHQLMVANGVDIFFQGHDHLYAWEKMDDLVYQEVPMPSDTSYEIGVLANADAYTDLTLDGSGHLRVTVESDCVSVDYVAAYLPADTLDVHKNREIRHTYKVCEGAVSTGGGYSVDSPFFEIFPNPAKGNLNIRAKSDIAHDRRIDLFSLQGQMLRSGVLPAGEESCAIPLPGLSTGIYWVKLTGHDKSSFQKLMIEQD
ncbi:MAG: T9SS type A sorting domain-containing protein, partial [Saprospiraceae bacterium]|nr:T9SS type A sorting domain-containing protein [Saprospiraceae bacterium]